MNNELHVAKIPFSVLGAYARSRAISTDQENEFGDPKELVESLINSISYNVFIETVKSKIVDSITSAIEEGASAEDINNLIESCKRAQAFALRFPFDFVVPEISYDVDYEISFEWESRKRKWFSLSVGSDGNANFASIIGLTEMHGKFSTLYDIPGHIFSLIKEATH